MVWVVLTVSAWLACGVLAGCGAFAHFQDEFPSIADEEREGDIRFAVFNVLGGPLSLAGGWVVTGYKHGFRRFW